MVGIFGTKNQRNYVSMKHARDLELVYINKGK